MHSNGDPRWLQIAVTDSQGQYPIVLSPRYTITPAPPTRSTRLRVAGGGGSLWSVDGVDISYTDGFVGVGEEFPWAPLTVVSQGGSEAVAVENYGDNTSVRLAGTSAGVSASSFNPMGAGVYASNLSFDTGICARRSGATRPIRTATRATSTDAATSRTTSALAEYLQQSWTSPARSGAEGFQLTDMPVSGYVLTCDDEGNGFWLPGGSGSSLWAIDAEGINYQSGNVGIGADSQSSARLLVEHGGRGSDPRTQHTHPVGAGVCRP